MALRLRIPVLLVAVLSIGLNLAIIGTAARTLHVFDAQKTSNKFFLPVWSSHFDNRELNTLIGTAAAIVVLNAVLVAAMFVPTVCWRAQRNRRGQILVLLTDIQLLVNTIAITASSLSFIASLIAIIVPTVVDRHTPYRETLQTWTCLWRNIGDQAVPREFDTMCHESRFAFYTTIPSFVAQLALLAIVIGAVILERSRRRVRLHEEEKGHEFDQVHVRPSKGM